jgi:hypothetical protein
MKSLKNLKKASFVALSALVLTLGLAAAPQAFAKENGDRGDRGHKEDRRDRGDRGDRHESNRGDRGDRGDNFGDMDWDNN